MSMQRQCRKRERDDRGPGGDEHVWLEWWMAALPVGVVLTIAAFFAFGVVVAIAVAAVVLLAAWVSMQWGQWFGAGIAGVPPVGEAVELSPSRQHAGRPEDLDPVLGGDRG
jgi:fatty acid desaturase